jgi:NAD(P)H-hydrate epimerase
MQEHKVVTAEEMSSLEKGGDLSLYMQTAGLKIAECVIEYIEERHLPKKVTLLVGKGNNGGDAYAAGLWLLGEGYNVKAIALYEEVSPLNRAFREKFQKKRGKFTGELEGLIVDGLLGTGLKGKPEKRIAEWIEKANNSALPIIAIDIPSGLNGTTGEGEAIFANVTVALGFAKMGFFLRNGWNYVGKLVIADFGLPPEKIAEAEPIAYLPKHLELPKLIRNRHKYQAGYVVGYAGSSGLTGAAKLTGFAALKAGAGIVRLYHPDKMESAPWELICNEWDLKCWQKNVKKANSIFVGPGLGPCRDWLKKHLKEIQKPCVIDADALLPKMNYPKGAILTPHRGEALRLLGLEKAPREEEFFAALMKFCARKQLVIVLKGAPTFIFAPKHKPFIIPRGDPGMATAGAGDVLTGIIAAMLAQGCEGLRAAILGVSLHAIAGEMAAKELTSYCLTATDLIDFMPAAFATVLQGHDIV